MSPSVNSSLVAKSLMICGEKSDPYSSSERDYLIPVKTTDVAKLLIWVIDMFWSLLTFP